MRPQIPQASCTTFLRETRVAEGLRAQNRGQEKVPNMKTMFSKIWRRNFAMISRSSRYIRSFGSRRNMSFRKEVRTKGFCIRKIHWRKVPKFHFGKRTRIELCIIFHRDFPKVTRANPCRSKCEAWHTSSLWLLEITFRCTELEQHRKENEPQAEISSCKRLLWRFLGTSTENMNVEKFLTRTLEYVRSDKTFWWRE